MDEDMDPLRARVFISCGQSKQSDEVEVAHRISERLEAEGFAPYVAVEEQTLVGLTENIFGRLRNSEYFVFVDFMRERLGTTEWHRGSLFSHQELAIAAFLNIDAIIAFQEKGVKTDDGMLRFLQANAEPFTDRYHLPSVVADFVRKRGWVTNWRNELVLERESEEFTDSPAKLNAQKQLLNIRFFHIKVRNHHREKLAANCSVYLEKATQLPNTNIPLKTVEFKWAGVQMPSVGIAPDGVREFDAFYILHPNPTQVQFHALSDSPHYYPVLPKGSGDYELSYVVRSENFPPARGTFKLCLRDQLNDTIFS
jgi:hypothetical protein